MREIRFLLDSNAAIDLLNRSRALSISVSGASPLALPLTVLGELEFGARNSANPVKNLDAIERLLKECELIAPDRATAVIYGRIQSDLRRRGRPIPTNDVWIAALAIQHGYTLVTRDNHFQEVDGLNAISW
jgi:tRNA(fMet)-specific endonuclease VapC